jgi:hypothetical protein
MFWDQVLHVMVKVIVLDDWLLFVEIQDLDYDDVHELNDYIDDDDEDYDNDVVVVEEYLLVLAFVQQVLPCLVEQH